MKLVSTIFGFILMSQYVYATAGGGFTEPKKEISRYENKADCWREVRFRTLRSGDKFTLYSCEPDFASDLED